MRSLFLALLAVPVLVGANQAHALNLCARVDKATGEPREGMSIKLRSQCRGGEAAIGSTEEFAMIRANRADIDETRVDVDINSEAIDAARSDGEPAQVAAARPATSARASDGCGLTVTAGDAVFNACNVHVQSGAGATWGTGVANNGTVNGLGNLVVGYDEGGGDKTGSHNLVVGSYHSYPSYGGFIAGRNNAANVYYSSVSGGYVNTAAGPYSSVSGGFNNTAAGPYSSVSGGWVNTASGDASSVSGGYTNTASGDYSSVSGGNSNTASGELSSVSGGQNNTASGDYSSVSGGNSSEGFGSSSAVSGGLENTASGQYSSVSGGGANTASGPASSASGGLQNIASSDNSAISGGWQSTASGTRSTVAGGFNQTASGDNSIAP